MGWDSSRTVPWRRLAREWLIYVGIMAAVFLVVFRDRPFGGILAGLLISAPLYLVIGFVLAKFGYQRKSLRQLRDERPTRSGAAPAGEVTTRPRPKPPPTRRTGGGGRPGGPKGKRRR